MRLLLLASLFVAPVVLADVGMRNHGVYIGPVRDIDCSPDGGLSCTRDSGVAIARIRCMGATATEPGCIVPSAQTFAGNKTWTGTQRHTPVAHASLAACNAGAEGTWQACDTHGSPVFCNGSSNVELMGAVSTTGLVVFPVVPVNGLLHAKALTLSGFTMPYAFTITRITGFIGAGTGSGDSLNVRFTDTSNNCDCAVDCDTDQVAAACSGNCSFAADTLVTASVVSDACDSPPTVKGFLTPSGY